MRLAFIIGLILWGWVEFSAFIFIGGEIGALLTLLGIFVTAIVGLSLLKNQGRAVMANLRNQVTRGEAPLKSVADSLSLLVGGILMLIPGYVTDAIGLMLFVPGIRTAVGFLLMSRLKNNTKFSGFASMHANQANAGATTQPRNSPTDNDDIIEGEFEERPNKPSNLPK